MAAMAFYDGKFIGRRHDKLRDELEEEHVSLNEKVQHQKIEMKATKAKKMVVTTKESDLDQPLLINEADEELMERHTL